MSKTLVFRFHTWDITNDIFQKSARWATKEAIEKVSGEVISDGVEVDEAYLGHEVDGMTARGFDPRNPPLSGFQNKVR
jgi:hypothetical protein